MTWVNTGGAISGGGVTTSPYASEAEVQALKTDGLAGAAIQVTATGTATTKSAGDWAKSGPLDASATSVTASGSTMGRTMGDWLAGLDGGAGDSVVTRNPADNVSTTILRLRPSTAGFEGFQTIHWSGANPSPQQATLNHGVWTGWNAGRHGGGPDVVNGKPAMIMGFEDNYFDSGGDNQFGMEWYVEYWSPDGTSVQMLRPFYTRVLSNSNAQNNASTIFNIGTDGFGQVAIRTAVGNNLFYVTGTDVVAVKKFTVTDTTEASDSSTASGVFKGGLWVNKRLFAAGNIYGNKISATSVAGGSFAYDASADRLALGILPSLPTSSVGGYVGWANGIAGTLTGDLVLIPRSDISGAVHVFTGSGTPVERLKIDANGATIGAAGTAISASIRATGTLGTSAISAGTTATQNITVTGAVVGAEVAVGGPATLEAGLSLFAYVSATNTVTLRVANVSGGSITPAGSQTVSVRVFNP